MGVSLAENDDDDDFGETHDINVTPFIDVILVLLIIFMVAAPLSTVDIQVDLPTVTTVQPEKKPDKPTFISIKSDLAIAIGDNFVKRVDLVRSLDSALDADRSKPIFLRVDRSVPYGEFFDVLDILRKGKYRNLKVEALEGVPSQDGAAQAEPASPAKQ